jgi:hypothetical protein
LSLTFVLWLALWEEKFKFKDKFRLKSKCHVTTEGVGFCANVNKWHLGRGGRGVQNRPKKCHVLLEWSLTSNKFIASYGIYILHYKIMFTEIATDRIND